MAGNHWPLSQGKDKAFTLHHQHETGLGAQASAWVNPSPYPNILLTLPLPPGGSSDPKGIQPGGQNREGRFPSSWQDPPTHPTPAPESKPGPWTITLSVRLASHPLTCPLPPRTSPFPPPALSQSHLHLPETSRGREVPRLGKGHICHPSPLGSLRHHWENLTSDSLGSVPGSAPCCLQGCYVLTTLRTEILSPLMSLGYSPSVAPALNPNPGFECRGPQDWDPVGVPVGSQSP